MVRTAGSRWLRLAGLGVVAVMAAPCFLVFSSGFIGTAGAAPRPFGDAKLPANVPTPPGFPEGIAVRGDRLFVAGPATSATIGKGPSQVVVFDKNTGSQLDAYPTKGENTAAEHANSSIAFDGKGRLYVLNTQIGMYRLLLDDQKTQQAYSTPFPALHPCLLSPPGTPCSPGLVDLPPCPTNLAFADSGDAYVTDSFHATI